MHDPELPAADRRAEARRLYGADPAGYDDGRPDYPERVYEVLRTRCHLGATTSVLEIGPGTGKVTRRLARLGARVVAVEPDAALAAHLRCETAGTGVEVLDGAFEDVAPAQHGFDLVVAAMSFHWVDQDRGLPILTRTVRPGGWVALWWTLFGDPSRPDPFREAARPLLAPPAVDAAPRVRPPFEIDVVGWTHALAGRAGLVDVHAELIRWTARLDAERLRAFHASTIEVRRRPGPEREALLDDLVRLAITDFGGSVERPFVTALYTARRP